MGLIIAIGDVNEDVISAKTFKLNILKKIKRKRPVNFILLLPRHNLIIKLNKFSEFWIHGCCGIIVERFV